MTNHGYFGDNKKSIWVTTEHSFDQRALNWLDQYPLFRARLQILESLSIQFVSLPLTRGTDARQDVQVIGRRKRRGD